MDKRKLIAGLKTLEKQIIELLKRINTTNNKLRLVIGRELNNHEGITALLKNLQKDSAHLRDLYQQVIFKSTLLAKMEEGKEH